MYRILNSDPAPLAALVPDLNPEVARDRRARDAQRGRRAVQSLDDMRKEILVTARGRLEGVRRRSGARRRRSCHRRTAKRRRGQLAAYPDAGPALPGACPRRRRARFHTGGARGACVLCANARLRPRERAEAARSRCPSRFEATRDRGGDRGCPVRGPGGRVPLGTRRRMDVWRPATPQVRRRHRRRQRRRQRQMPSVQPGTPAGVRLRSMNVSSRFERRPRNRLRPDSVPSCSIRSTPGSIWTATTRS